MVRWSEPYYGVTHANVNGRQVTVSQYPRHVEATVFPVPGTPNFFERADWRDFPGGGDDSIAIAKAWGERTAQTGEQKE